MKRLITTAAALTIAMSAAGTPATAAVQAPAKFNQCGYHPTTTVHLRTGPGARYTSLGLLGTSDSVRADKASDGWYRVTTSDRARSGLPSGTVGWVAKQYLKANVCMRLN
ncbi:SH3 domain-containing protein [Streptomyces sp. NRRL F-5065]|uniref:SH3 domain-containing protein n=1 Tax=Streptomyces sp. NRRL F-5065 TaxID=1463855 RepID=UPI00131B7500|nr:SH3 domain-containing protein [Streptomyces sp. NRRL F-5065]